MSDVNELNEIVARTMCRDYYKMMGYFPNEIVFVESKDWREWLPDADIVVTEILKTHDLVKRTNCSIAEIRKMNEIEKCEIIKEDIK